MITTFEVPTIVAARLAEKDFKKKNLKSVMHVGHNSIVPISDWLAYKTELAAQGLAVVYMGWPTGERCPVWNIVKEQA